MVGPGRYLQPRFLKWRYLSRIVVGPGDSQGLSGVWLAGAAAESAQAKGAWFGQVGGSDPEIWDGHCYGKWPHER
jgi:hypothetical protein